MKKNITCAAAMLCVLGMVSAEAENSSLASIVIAQVQPSTTVTFCRDAESLSFGKNDADSTDLPHQNIFSPLSAEFFKKIGKPYTGSTKEAQQYKASVLEAPKHGEIQQIDDFNDWTYLPAINYEGTDRINFLVESQGKRYKVVVNFLVAHIFDENRTKQVCDSIDFGTSDQS